MPGKISQIILDWYQQNARELPWRSSYTPYAIWVSEIMLQQTQVETVIPYYQKWLEKYPTVQILANAPQNEVLKLWEGLGYYARARNMHRCARIISEKFSGEFPQDYDALLKLPGIGPYTAAAICSFAFHQDLPAVDANLKRVLARLFVLSEPVNTPKFHNVYVDLAASLVPSGKSSAYNQGLMDLGSAICLPRNPKCGACPLQTHCEARTANSTDAYPVRKKAGEKPRIIVTAAVIQQNGQYLITQRPENCLLGSMWEFPGGKQEKGETLEACLIREIKEELAADIQVKELLGVYKHSYTHYHVTLHAFICRLLSKKIQRVEIQDYQWVKVSSLNDFPMGKIDRSISKDLARIK